MFQVGWGALNLNSTIYPNHDHHGDPPLSGKNPHDRAGNQTRDLMIGSQKCWPIDHEAGHVPIVLKIWEPQPSGTLRAWQDM
jgi:hypothetical protein